MSDIEEMATGVAEGDTGVAGDDTGVAEGVTEDGASVAEGDTSVAEGDACADEDDTSAEEGDTSADVTQENENNSGDAPVTTERFKMKRTSLVWSYFSQGSYKYNASCNECSKTISTAGGNTTNMKKHLRLFHQKLFSELQQKESEKNKDGDPKRSKPVIIKPIKLYVGNLPSNTKPEDLQAAFEKYGQVEECDVLRNYGFIHISNEDEARVAMESLNNSDFNGSRITVEISHNKGQCYRCGRQGHIPKECPLNAKTYTRTNNSSISKESWWCNEEVQDAVDEKKNARKKWEESQTDEDRKVYVEKKKEAKRKVAQAKAQAYRSAKDSKRRDGRKSFYNKAPQWKKGAKDEPQATKLFVGNLSESVTSDDLRTLFETYGEVEECDVLKNYGFVHMTNEDEAKEAVASLHQTEFMDTKIKVEISKSRGQCYSCGQQGHWSKECMSNMGGRSGFGSSNLMSRFGRQFDRGFAMDMSYRTQRMRPYPDMYDRRPLGPPRASNDDFYGYGYGFPRPTTTPTSMNMNMNMNMNSGNNYERDYNYGQYRRPQAANTSTNYNYMWSSSNPNTA